MRRERSFKKNSGIIAAEKSGRKKEVVAVIEQSQLPVVHACDALALSKPTYYRWRVQQEKDHDAALRPVMHKIALEFPFYGYRRVTKELQQRGERVNHKRILRIMREERILCRRKKRFKPITTQSNHGFAVYPNLVKDLAVTRLNQVWVADITYIHLPRGFVYLAVILDLLSRKCVGWGLSRSIDTQLALEALNKAIAAREHLGFAGLIHHSDRGVQYASQAYVDQLTAQGISISMSSKGNAYDNAFAESFMKTLKVEEVYINEYATFDEAYANIKQFIDLVYNEKRLHSSIGYKSPMKFEQEVLNISLT